MRRFRLASEEETPPVTRESRLDTEVVDSLEADVLKAIEGVTRAIAVAASDVAAVEKDLAEIRSHAGELASVGQIHIRREPLARLLDRGTRRHVGRDRPLDGACEHADRQRDPGRPEGERPDHAALRGDGGDRRHRRHDLGRRAPDEPPGPQRHHRGGTGRRGRTGLCGRGKRSEGRCPPRPARPPTTSASASTACARRPRPRRAP